MAGVLRKLTPTLEPSGRVIELRQLVAGNPRESRLVQVRLGCREDKADYAKGFCLARKKGGGFDQCARRPARGAPDAPAPVVCGVHGGGHGVRQRNGTRLSPQEAGRLSGLARRIKRDGRVDLTQLPSLLPVLQQQIQRLREQPALLDLQEDVIRLTALREIMLSGQLDIEAGDLVRMLAVLTQVKANAIKTKHAIETCDMVPGPRVREMMGKMVEIIRQFTPEERLPEVARALRLLTPDAAPAGNAAE